MRRCKDEGHEFLCRLGAGSCFRQGPSSCNADEPGSDEGDTLERVAEVLAETCPDRECSSWEHHVEQALRVLDALRESDA